MRSGLAGSTTQDAKTSTTLCCLECLGSVGGQLQSFHVFDEIVPCDCVSVLRFCLSGAPNQFGLRDYKVAQVFVLVVIHVEFQSLVFKFHCNVELFDAYVHEFMCVSFVVRKF